MTRIKSVKSGDFEIAQRLKTLRLEHGASMTQMCNLIDVCRPTMQEVEKGTRSITLREVIIMLSYYGLGIETITSAVLPDSSIKQVRLENIIANELGRLTSISFRRVITKAEQIRQSALKEGNSKPRPISIARAVDNIAQYKDKSYVKSLKS